MTDTPALRVIPGSARMKAGARAAQPVRPPDDARGRGRRVHLLCLDEAAWINGALIRADGGEHVARRRRLSGDLFVHGLGHFHPENRIDNRFLDVARHRHRRRLDHGAGGHPRRAARCCRSTTSSGPKNEHPLEAARGRSTRNAETGARAARLAMERAGHRPVADRPGDRGRLLAAVLDPGRGLPDRRRTRHPRAGLRRQLRVLELRRAAAPPARDAPGGAARLRARGQRREHDAHRRLPRPPHGRALGRRQLGRRRLDARSRRRVRVRAERRALGPGRLEQGVDPAPAATSRRRGRRSRGSPSARRWRRCSELRARTCAATGPRCFHRPPGEPADAQRGVRAGAGRRRRATCSTWTSSATAARPARRRPVAALGRAAGRDASWRWSWSDPGLTWGGLLHRRREGLVKYAEFLQRDALLQGRSCSPARTARSSRTRRPTGSRTLPGAADADGRPRRRDQPPRPAGPDRRRVRRARSTPGSSSATSGPTRCSRAASASTRSGS